MKKLLLLSLLLSGCSMVKIDSAMIDPTTKQLVPCKAERIGVLMASHEITGTICGGSVSAKDSKVDAEVVKAAVEAAVNAATMP